MKSSFSSLQDAGTPLDSEWFDRAVAGLEADERHLLAQAVARVRDPLAHGYVGTGEPLAEHGAAVVITLAEMGADIQTRCAALLCLLPSTDADGREVRWDSLRKEFGSAVVALVQGARALVRLGDVAARVTTEGSPPGSDQKEMRRKMLLAMAADLRIVLLRLASRLQSLRWYARTKTPCPADFARETMELYTPLANRLGIWQVKWEMEDLSFRFLQPETYKDIARQLEEKRVEREASIVQAVERLRTALADVGVAADVTGRPKHIYSIWNKMRNKHLSFNQLYDLRALRVIVEDERACYNALALVHSLWTPLSDEFDDYISRPKPNGYRSLHTVVLDTEGRTFEIQIRTREMHEFAEYGMAAHWRYKEAGPKGGQVSANTGYDQKIAWMRQLLAAEAEVAARDGSSSAVQADAQSIQSSDHERIYVMTPQARVIELPVGSTPVDFAYYLHTDLGHRCRGARVDGQMVPLLTRLSTGQTVEIIAAKSGGPSRDWLNPQLGFLASPRSRAKVRAWFNAVELQQRISQGQTMVEKELQRLGKTAVNLEHMAQQLGFARADDLYVAVAKDEFSLRAIDQLLSGARDRIASDERSSDAVSARLGNSSSGDAFKPGKRGVLVVGVDSLMTQLARCCRPAPPDHIKGFVTRGRGVSIHRADCASYAALAARHPERLIEVDWGDTDDALYPVDIVVYAQERANLLRDVSEVFAKLRINIISVNTHSRRSLGHMVFTVEVRSGEQIARVVAALNELPGVDASRQ